MRQLARRLCSAWWCVFAVLVACAAPPASAPPLESHQVCIGDLDQHYRTLGSGPPLLLLHGLTDSWRTWRPHITALAAQHQLIIPDLRGHGDTPDSLSMLSPGQVARDMFALLDTLGINQVQIIGYSFGGHVALRMASLKPDRVEALISVAGAHRLLGAAQKKHEELAHEVLQPGWWLSEVSTWHPGGENQVRQLWRTGVASVLAADFAMSDSAVAGIRARTLIIQGDRDEFFPVDVPLDLYHRIPKAQLWLIPNTTHDAVFGWEGIAPPDLDAGGTPWARRVFPDVANAFLGKRK
jgi:pimeloyl-ACP methyl ester carboxylesterase